MSRISAIVAVTKNMGIGVGDDLLVYNSQDMAFFSGYTMGKCVFVGHNTNKTLPNLLGRQVIEDPSRGCEVDLKTLPHRQVLSEVVVIGGAKTYAKYADQIEELYITKFNQDGADADVFFPVESFDHLCSRVVVLKNRYFTVEKWS